MNINEKNMKIALCLSGQPRGIPNSLHFALNSLIIPSNITDIFIHTWYDENLANRPFDSAQPNKNNTLGCWKPHTDKILIETFKPKGFLADSPKRFSEYSHLKNLESANQCALASGFYSSYISNKLKCDYEKENNFVYDVVIKTRIDILYHKPIIIQQLIDENIHTSAYVPQMYQHMRVNDSYPLKNGNTYSSMSDAFVISSSPMMDKITSVILDFENHYNNIYPFVYGEAYSGYVVRKLHNIPIIMKDIPFVLYRG